MPRFIGIDVQVARGCPFAVIDEEGCLIESGWIAASPALEAALLELCARHPQAVFGIDCPRMPLPAPRAWYWQAGAWRARRASEVGHGRHCEVVVKAHAIANPQWTTRAGDAPEWMRLGFRIFEALAPRARAHEVFPSATYRMLEGSRDAKLTLSFEHFRPGPKDMLDATVAALTVREFEADRGCEVGGGDGLGTIVLPRPLANPIARVLEWPRGTLE